MLEPRVESCDFFLEKLISPPMKLDHHKPPKKHLFLALLNKKFTEKNMGGEYMAGIRFLKWDPCVGQMQSCSGQLS
jgi:hypothetical protein